METIIVQSLIAIGTIISAWGIAHYQIVEGRKLNTENLRTNAENAGKNRTIYAIEEIVVPIDSKAGWIVLNTQLNSGNYTILTTYADPQNHRNRIYALGKIKP